MSPTRASTETSSSPDPSWHQLSSLELVTSSSLLSSFTALLARHKPPDAPASHRKNLRADAATQPQDTTTRGHRAETNQMALLCSATARPPRAFRARGEPPRGRRPARTVVAAGARISGAEARASLVLALASQALAASQRRAADLAAEAAKYAFPSRRFEPRTLEEALMSGQWWFCHRAFFSFIFAQNPRVLRRAYWDSRAFAVPDLETVPFRVLKREAEYEIRQVEVIVVIIYRIVCSILR